MDRRLCGKFSHTLIFHFVLHACFYAYYHFLEESTSDPTLLLDCLMQGRVNR